MARDYQVPGECMVYVKGRAGSAIAALTELGLTEDPVTIVPEWKHHEINLNAWGTGGIPNEVQWMLGAVTVQFNLIHFDPDVLDVCLREAQGGSTGPGTMRRAGIRLGNGAARFAATNFFIGLNLTSPITNKPYRFYHSFLTGNPAQYRIGVEKQVVPVQFRVIPYSPDPWNGGTGAEGVVLWDNTLDN